MLRFLVKAGVHSENGVLHETGKIVETNSNLVDMFGKNSFEQLESEKEPVEESNRELSYNEAKFGSDVTDKFSTASDLGFLVLKKGNYYNIIDTDSPEETLNSKALKKKEVQDFLEEYE